ncbi:capsule assembly Wzi family protein [Pseudoalteromonas ulvae]|uniref:Capsule assembly Wzi family protein n=1 Tax=Pseudoalteromonas ulvae TaxID=107327 RepID=A0A244CQ09_PSEDV|nr:capsule assembly Wzi family protein [Pseudoalteromonas ulvae]OUL57710.1 hypothetical protein B1199_11670 [Pseudoalteromonas ulvae]
MKLKYLSTLLLALCSSPLLAKPTAYLPIHIDSHLERQVDTMFVLTTGTPMSKPYAFNEIDIALRQLRTVDKALYDAIRVALKPYRGQDQISRSGIRATAKYEKTMAIPNQRGLQSDEWGQGFFEGIWRPSESTLVQVGLDYRFSSGDLVAYNTFVSLAGESLQLDVGYKEHWFSPFKHSAQMISTNAKTSPSISLGLTQPIADWWNLDFELYYSKLENVEKGIGYQGEWHDGRPLVAGTHLSIEPISGWKIGLNRILHFGGGPREVSVKDIFKAYFDPASNDNKNGDDEELGDQLGSITNVFNFNWGTPAELYFEYGGEDTKEYNNYEFGNGVFAGGVYLPKLTSNWSIRYEYTSWHSLWYVNSIYKYGNTNDGAIYGHFAGDQRTFSDATPSDIHLIDIGYNEDINSSWHVKLTTIDNLDSATDYQRSLELQLSNSRKWQEYRIESQITYGTDVFDEKYGHLSVTWFW